MSTDEVEKALERHIAEGRLHLWSPSRRLPRRHGRLLLTREALTKVGTPWLEPENREPLRAEVRAVFDRFSAYGRGLIDLLDPLYGRAGIAQMKIMAPDPGVRLFGGALDPDTYIGTRLYWRDELPFKPAGQPGDIDYKTLGQELRQHWEAELADLPRINVDDLRMEL